MRIERLICNMKYASRIPHYVFYKKWCFIFLFLIIGCSQPAEEVNPVLLISFDGFRYDYLSKTDTPNFDSLAANGVKAESLIPVFPTKTFPNHYSIATGLYPENTGIIGNTMYDPEYDEWYRISDQEAVGSAKWYSGEPIWNTVEKQGLKAGIMFWVGSEAPIQEMRPTYWKPYDGSVPAKARIDTVVKWLSYDDERAVDFAALYFSFVDGAGHRYGPQSDEVEAAIRKADKLMGYLKKQLIENDLWKDLNLIVLSDHGMVQLSSQKIVLLDSIINMSNIERIITYSPVAMIQPETGKTEMMFQKLNEASTHYRVYKKEDLPERFHLKNNPRVPELMLIADIGYSFVTREYKEEFLSRLPGGTHGYDNQNKKMHAFFLARGPAFKNGMTVGSFQNIHIYELITDLLDIEAAPNDGSLDNVKLMLK